VLVVSSILFAEVVLLEAAELPLQLHLSMSEPRGRSLSRDPRRGTSRSTIPRQPIPQPAPSPDPRSSRRRETSRVPQAPGAIPPPATTPGPRTSRRRKDPRAPNPHVTVPQTTATPKLSERADLSSLSDWLRYNVVRYSPRRLAATDIPHHSDEHIRRLAQRCRASNLGHLRRMGHLRFMRDLLGRMDCPARG